TAPGGNKKKSTKAAPAKPLAASTAGDEAAAPADAAARWYRDPLTKAALKPSEPSEPGGKAEFARKKGGEALAQLAKAFRSDMQTSRSFAIDRFAIRVLESGTQADRVGVMTGLVRDHPLESLAHLEALVAMVTPKAKRDALTVLDAVKSLFLEHLLPPGRRLVPLDRRPFTRLAPVLARKGRDAARHVRALWYFEERLGQLLQQFLDRLDGLLRDPVDAARLRAVAAVAELAVGHRDCRSRAMASLANKLGDPSRRVCGAALHRLRLLAAKQPEMKAALVDEIERLLFRGNADSAAARGVNSGVARTHRYAVCLLCQLPLTAADTNAGGVAGRLAGIYLAFFKAAAKRQEVAGRLFAGLLTGLHRALPFCGPDKLAELSEHARLLFGLVHLAGFNVGVQCLLVLFQLVQRDPSLSDRFYRALYQRLLDIGPVAKRAMLMHLLYRSLSWDSRLPRVRAFVRRILQVATMQDSAFACASLLLIGQLEGDRPGLVTDMLSGGAAPAPADATTGTPMAAAAAASYDPLSRQPEFCGAEAEPLWELPHYLSHCHPSVRLFRLPDYCKVSHCTPPPGDPSARFRPRRRSSSAAGAKLAPSREELARIPDEAS
uniref:CBF domain-containing protein n=1 Tax=Macrostomum lignano TaxID=282301 RepID=A0A1I8IWX0_9PLAT